jgi:hypothetical protein
MLVRDIGVVARYELGQALRTRLLQVVLLGYAAAMFAADLSFVSVLRVAESEVAMQLGVPPTEKPGTLLAHVTQSSFVRAALAEAVGSDRLTTRLLDLPLLGVWAGAVATTALPMVLLLGCAGSLAGEVQSRSVRYLVLRTERLAIVLGKFVGQLCLAGLALLVGGVVTAGVGQFWMVGQSPLGLLATSVAIGARGLAVALPFGALGLFVSQWVPSRNGARVLAIVVVLACAIAVALVEEFAGSSLLGVTLRALTWFSPTSGFASVWTDDLGELGAALARLGVLVLAWIAAGFARFATRDL